MFCDDCYEKGCAELKSKEDDKNTRQNEAISADDNVNNANKDSSAGKSSQSAIDILRTVNSIVAFCGVIIVVGLLLVSLTTGVPFLLVAVFGFGLLVFVMWAVNRVFIGIAEDVKGIRQKLEDSNSTL
jgi:Flp pilus assembly protein TadB